MSLAEEMLMSMPDQSVSALSEADVEPHIKIGEDRSIFVPAEIKMIGVQLDKDVEELVFDCPRYVEDVDLYEFVIYINYMLSNGTLGTIVPHITIDSQDDSIIHFSWLVERYLTENQGAISFNITAKKTDDEGNLLYQWSTLVDSSLTVAKGMETGKIPITPEQKDLINQIFSLLNEGIVITSIEYIATEASGAYNRLKIHFSNGSNSWSEEFLIRNGEQGPQGEVGPPGPQGEPGTTDYNALDNKPVIPSSVNAVEHQYAVSNSKDSISTVETWNGITSSLSQRERSCIFANGYYVVCGVGGEVGYSKDGVNWTKIAPFYSKTLTNIAYGKGKFIIVDEDSGLWMAEETPISWSKIDVTFSAGIGSLTYANSRFVIAGAYMCAFSEDGIKWTEVEAPGEYNQITFGGGRYVAVGANGSVGVSYDGTTWVDRSNPDVTGDLRGVVYAKGKYIIGGIDGLIMYTEDFVTWGIATSHSAGVRYVRQITYAENKYYAACYTSAGKGEIWISVDGITWTVQQQMNVRLWCLAYNNGQLIAAGDSGSVYILDLGIVWQTKQTELSEGQYLWERIVFTLSDGGQVVSDGVFIKAYQKTEDWTFTLEDGTTVTKAVCIV